MLLPAYPQVCAAIWKWSINNETMITNLGDWCKNQKGRWGQSDKFYWVSRPSDYMLTHFKLFSEVWAKYSIACTHNLPCLPEFHQHHTASGMMLTVQGYHADCTVASSLCFAHNKEEYAIQDGLHMISILDIHLDNLHGHDSTCWAHTPCLARSTQSAKVNGSASLRLQ